MATKIHFWNGSIAWAKVYDPDTFNGASRWMINFYPDDMDEVKDSGCQAEPKEDVMGESYIRLRRDTQKLFGEDLTKFAPPRLTGEVEVKYINSLTGEDVYSYSVSEGVELEQVGERVSLGNGTRVTARVAVYDTSRGKGTRLEGLRILELVEYNPDVAEENKAADNNGEAVVKKATKAKAKAKKAEKEETKEKAPWD